ncbi:hypothetical protein G5C65_37200, partial [Streptomyces sp. SB3404]|nr:hypothetical protein [Streptomyces boncukensis]
RVFVKALGELSAKGDDMPAALRGDMAKIMVNHGHEVHVAMSDVSGKREPAHGPTLDSEQVMAVTKQVSRSQGSYDTLQSGMNHAMVADFHDSSRKPADTLSSAGYTVGFMEEARRRALEDDQPDFTWDKAKSYHAIGGVLNFIPHVGDIAQRGADMVTTAWIQDEEARAEGKLKNDNKAIFAVRQNQLNQLADQWHATNRDWAADHAGYSAEDGVYKQVNAAADHGNKRFARISGG